MCKTVLGVIAVLLACSSFSKAGLETTSADEAVVNGYAVVIARVQEIKKVVDSRDGTQMRTIDALATIAGDFDPSSASKLTVALSVDAATSSVEVAAKTGHSCHCGNSSV